MMDEVTGAVVVERVEVKEVGAVRPDELAVLRDSIAKLTGLVQVQQEERESQKAAMERLAQQGLRRSDMEAIPEPDLAALIEMTTEGFKIRLRGNWTMGLINQLRTAMRRQMMVDAADASRERRRVDLGVTHNVGGMSFREGG